MSSTDEIRAQIEETRRHLDVDIDAVAEKVNPSSIAHRQTEKVKRGLRGARDSVMGAADRGADGASGAASNNPLLVGLIAFGAGALLSSLVRSSAGEQRLAGRVQETAAPLTEAVSGAAKDTVSAMKQPVEDAAGSVREQARQAASTVQDEGRSAASDVKDRAARS